MQTFFKKIASAESFFCGLSGLSSPSCHDCRKAGGWHLPLLLLGVPPLT